MKCRGLEMREELGYVPIGLFRRQSKQSFQAFLSSPLRAQRDGPRALALHGSSKNPYRSALDTRSCSPSCLSRRRAERHQVGLPEFLTTDVTIENLSVLGFIRPVHWWNYESSKD
ncbi:hypothetical protein AOLI_G00330960 [Acnodon oligacanthus]